MDFDFWQRQPSEELRRRYRFQAEFVAAHPDSFERLEEHDPAGTSAAFFRFAAPLDFAAIAAPRVPLPKRLRHALAAPFRTQ